MNGTPSQAGRYVAVVGPGRSATAREIEVAYATGHSLAAAGCTVITGGLAGVMAAAAAGAAQAGGLSVGLLPGATRDGAAPALTVALPTGLGEARNALVVAAADGVIAVGGSWGTLSEIALARRVGKPVVCVGGWQIVAGAISSPVTAASGEDAVAELLALLAS